MNDGGLSCSGDGADCRDDQELVLAVRQGEIDGFATLYRRYVSHAHRSAARWADNPAEREDIVSESFGRLLAKIQEGGGPRGDFLPYLIRVIRNVAVDRVRRERYVEAYDDLEHIEASRPGTPDPVIAAWQRDALARALASLPPRWQRVLWQVEVEGQPPAKVAPSLGLSANAVAALAYRAREGLRQAYLQVHVQCTDVPVCDKTTRRLGAWARGGLSDRGSAEVRQHLRYCSDCQQRADTVLELNGELAGARCDTTSSAHRDVVEMTDRPTDTRHDSRSANRVKTKALAVAVVLLTGAMALHTDLAAGACLLDAAPQTLPIPEFFAFDDDDCEFPESGWPAEAGAEAHAILAVEPMSELWYEVVVGRTAGLAGVDSARDSW